ncbi:MAG: prolyl oligopeptidase family serine peptidase [Gemmataceae bacterium]|nr:prolyl oligopeptidase family serine peptidase [Gemmataceae bacterium]
MSSSRLPALVAGALLSLGGVQGGAQSPSVDEQIRKLADEAPLKMQFRGGTAEECRQWQAAFAAKLRELLGPHRPPASWEVTVERTVELDDHRREELLLTAKGHPPLPVYLLLPKGAKGPQPGVVAVHGHGAFGYDPIVGRALTPGVEGAIRSANYDYGRQLVRRGYVVAAPCLTPFGRRLGAPPAKGGTDPCAVTFVRLQLLGKVLMAENLRDVLWCVELLARRKDVDAERLGCVGLSYGGRMTMLAAALEPRIRVAVVSGALNCMQERIRSRYSCGAQVIPGLLKYGDVPEIASLIAPRPSLWEVGSEDRLLPPRWVETALDRMQRAYQALGAAEQLQVDRFKGGHRWHGEHAYPLLDRVLRRH